MPLRARRPAEGMWASTWQVPTVEAGLSVASLSSRRPTLEEYFVGLTGESGEVY